MTVVTNDRAVLPGRAGPGRAQSRTLSKYPRVLDARALAHCHVLHQSLLRVACRRGRRSRRLCGRRAAHDSRHCIGGRGAVDSGDHRGAGRRQPAACGYGGRAALTRVWVRVEAPCAGGHGTADSARAAALAAGSLAPAVAAGRWRCCEVQYLLCYASYGSWPFQTLGVH